MQTVNRITLEKNISLTFFPKQKDKQTTLILVQQLYFGFQNKL